MSKLGRKLRLLGTISLLMVTVSTGAVSTFAWFQAQANVNIQAQSTGTTISVNKPKDYTFYAYKGNMSYDYDGDGNIDNFTKTGTFTSDFATITSSNISALTSFGDMSPGDIKVFAIGVDSPNCVLLRLDEIISNNAEKQGLSQNRLHRFSNGTGTEINIGYAFDIFKQVYTPTKSKYPTGYDTFITSTVGTIGNAVAGTPLANGATSDKGVRYYTRESKGDAAVGELVDASYKYTYFKVGDGVWTADADNKYYPLTSQTSDMFKYYVSDSSDRTILNASGTGSSPNKVFELSSKIEFCNLNSLSSSNDFYIIWSVVYSDDPSIHYVEVDDKGTGGLDKIEPLTGPRYFKQDNNGNSNCFSNLKFALNKFTLTIG